MLWMILGFVLACYAVVGNDSIQTIGTFLASNKKKPWYIVWAYLGSILTVVLLYGWFTYNGDVSYGRLARIPVATSIEWWHVLPMLALLFLTRLGIPVSTTFMALSIFTGGSVVLEKIVTKSLVGYAVAFGATFIIWIGLAYLEKKTLDENKHTSSPFWTLLQWASTGFLWSQWLVQDLANVYVYAPRELPVWMLIPSLLLLLGLLALLVRERGGKIQEIISAKTNTLDIRSATFIDLVYGLTLYVFKTVNDLPMSTTWVFLGTLAGRELILTLRLKHKQKRLTLTDITSDLGKATIGLIISVVIAVSVRYFFVAGR
jgi:hypothetical protein